ncbi:synaptonemal complex central element protein 1 like [Phyllostomus discolor]|uniref:Synaptonemal complex central element protein 1 like n=1 Tax=Phyllostomus discolor TaxID=89673 RepID=A0A833YSI7_9CHIR|nr:synaptonemal complex central element protein 1 like [Phyllostomus discolor]
MWPWFLSTEALRTLQLHSQMKSSEDQRLHVEEQLEDLMGQHKDLWEFQMLEQRLAWEICALQSSKDQLLIEGGTPAWGGGQGSRVCSPELQVLPEAPRNPHNPRRELPASQAGAGGTEAAFAAGGRG